VRDDRPFWKTRPLAVGLAFLTGTLLLIALSVMVVGPRFGEWLAGKVHLSGLFVLLWPYIHWTIAVGFTILAVEALYFLAPNVKQHLRATLPRRSGGRGMLDRLVLPARALFSPFRELQQNLGNAGSGYRPDDVVVLDRLRHVGGSGTK
jgi:Virulence factor BrkB